MLQTISSFWLHPQNIPQLQLMAELPRESAPCEGYSREKPIPARILRSDYQQHHRPVEICRNRNQQPTQRNQAERICTQRICTELICAKTFVPYPVPRQGYWQLCQEAASSRCPDTTGDYTAQTTLFPAFTKRTCATRTRKSPDLQNTVSKLPSLLCRLDKPAFNHEIWRTPLTKSRPSQTSLWRMCSAKSRMGWYWHIVQNQPLYTIPTDTWSALHTRMQTLAQHPRWIHQPRAPDKVLTQTINFYCHPWVI